MQTDAKNIFGETIKVPTRGKHYVEPRGYAYFPGTGPSGKKCKDCANCDRHRAWFKCALYTKPTGGRGTDILANSPSCKFFNEDKNEKTSSMQKTGKETKETKQKKSSKKPSMDE